VSGVLQIEHHRFGSSTAIPSLAGAPSLHTSQHPKEKHHAAMRQVHLPYKATIPHPRLCCESTQA